MRDLKISKWYWKPNVLILSPFQYESAMIFTAVVDFLVEFNEIKYYGVIFFFNFG